MPGARRGFQGPHGGWRANWAAIKGLAGASGGTRGRRVYGGSGLSRFNCAGGCLGSVGEAVRLKSARRPAARSDALRVSGATDVHHHLACSDGPEAWIVATGWMLLLRWAHASGCAAAPGHWSSGRRSGKRTGITVRLEEARVGEEHREGPTVGVAANGPPARSVGGGLRASQDLQGESYHRSGRPGRDSTGGHRSWRQRTGWNRRGSGPASWGVVSGRRGRGEALTGDSGSHRLWVSDGCEEERELLI